ncbi:hypothetical protein M0L20_07905 [Spirosoma sp. RP8]|uniref:Uncharacterized protein n=1 Tax=Spirosoma liriopis TaxID=2937440 RepID=A0ABT0HHY4_9BACT|nr:hypothetical protein [Spirosoma liriopis]MCK8491773.1 hypothetical protein [Spirosoma liriopis]
MKWNMPLGINIPELGNAQAKIDLDAVIEKGRRSAVQWDDLAVASTVLVDLENVGLLLIKRLLGYLPPQHVTLPYETYLRALVHNYRQNQLSGNDFIHQAIEHVKMVRNADMKQNLCSTYPPRDYTYYHETFTPYGLQVKQRLTRFLGYEPHLNHSLSAELWLRAELASDASSLSESITAVDIRAITLIKYREALLDNGKLTADKSPLQWDLVLKTQYFSNITGE